MLTQGDAKTLYDWQTLQKKKFSKLKKNRPVYSS